MWPGLTAFPDFSNEETHEWWYENLKRYHQQVPFDGLWIVSVGVRKEEGYTRVPSSCLSVKLQKKRKLFLFLREVL